MTANDVIDGCMERWNPSTRACSHAKQTVVTIVIAGASLPLTGFYWNCWLVLSAFEQLSLGFKSPIQLVISIHNHYRLTLTPPPPQLQLLIKYPQHMSLLAHRVPVLSLIFIVWKDSLWLFPGWDASPPPCPHHASLTVHWYH